METLTVQIVTSHNWYAAGQMLDYVRKYDRTRFVVGGRRGLLIDKNHAIVTAVKYQTAEKEEVQ